MHRGFLVDTYSEVLGRQGWALAGGGGWARGKGSNGSSCTLWEGVEMLELQRKQDGRGAFPGMSHSSADQQHRTTFCELKRARSSYAPLFLWTTGFWSRLCWECLEGGLSRCLTDEMQRRIGSGGFVFVTPVLHFFLSRFFIFCFSVIFCDGHTLYTVGWQK